MENYHSPQKSELFSYFNQNKTFSSSKLEKHSLKYKYVIISVIIMPLKINLISLMTGLGERINSTLLAKYVLKSNGIDSM